MHRIKLRCRELSLSGVGVAAVLLQGVFLPPGEAYAQAACARTITANVVALDQPFFYNRFGSVNPAGMIYALRRDVVDTATGQTEAEGATLSPGSVALREDKRPRPIVLRANIGDCLEINFQNLLAPERAHEDQPVTRAASVHVMGMEYVNNILDDGGFIGTNPSSLVEPGGTATYTYLASHEGTQLLYSQGAMTGAEGDGGQLAFGLFGSVNVLPEGAEWYRSQVSEAELNLATTGTMPSGHPIIDYDAVYPAGHRLEGRPILRMLEGNEIVHSDLDAIITGPNRGDFAPGTYRPNPVIAPNLEQPAAPGAEVRTREEPFRDMTVIFHGEIKAVQSFPEFRDPVLGYTLASVKDGFGINYGVQGAGAIILANRKSVGPAAECNDCYYEEFFLSSWPNGDPAMIVDVPANAADPAQGNVATKVFYPADPANVHHAYLGDHVKMRNLHAGPKEHHVFHLHAHQWLFNPETDQSNYLDSQAIGPGSAYTYELVYNGAGNRNLTAGDSIFHCHFYPHFAQGMWELFRVHDTFEPGTELNDEGRPVPGARALPDRELTAPDGRKTGAPTPAVVPIPTRAMAPLPGDVEIDPETGNAVVLTEDINPGYPFFIPANVGHRAPQPALDMLHNGGLERHVVLDGESEFVINRLDFDKVIQTLDVQFLPQDGTPVEQTAMAFHEQRTHDTVTPEGNDAVFVTNGQPRAIGAPYADPCVDEFGNPQGLVNGEPARQYKVAAIQLDIVLNKVGWHYPQSRMLALWQDVDPLLAKQKAPEPLFFRANSGECIDFQLTNLQPHVRELDDYQVRAPTADTIGQHIHLVKFDVTSSDGAGNGWNYEDGSFGAQEVRVRIEAIRAFNNCGPDEVSEQCPEPEPHPFFGTGPDNAWLGAQITAQRWWADPIVTLGPGERHIRTVFSHDHFAPASQQHAAHYSALLVEPEGSVWRNPFTGEFYGGRDDGGPTSWVADIIPPDESESFREFGLAFEDFQLAYQQGGGGTTANPVPDPEAVINPPGRITIGLPDILAKPDQCPGGVPPPCPEVVAADDPGMFSVNYRNEPTALRVFDPATFSQADGRSGDLAFMFRSDVERVIPELNTVLGDTPYPQLVPGYRPGDPFTPLLQAYPGDEVHFRIVVGAHEEAMYATATGLKWLFEPDYADSGWRNTQMMTISEHFEFIVPLTPIVGTLGEFSDRLWSMSAATDGFWSGIWGLLRSYNQPVDHLLMLPNNQVAGNTNFQEQIANRGEFEARGVCPQEAPIREVRVAAVAARQVLPEGTLIYNPRQGAFPEHPGPLQDPTALLYVLQDDLQGPPSRPTLRDGAPIEPLIVRANAGDCIQLQLRNLLPDNLVEMDGWSELIMLIEGFNQNDLRASHEVGLRPQLVTLDPTRSMGWNVGLNGGGSTNQAQADQTAGPGEQITYHWYAGDLTLDENNNLVGVPVEFGATNLIPADPIEHSTRGLIGALIIEPEGATWETDPGTRAAATVTETDGSTFREFVTIFQDDVNQRDANNVPICPVTGGVPCEGQEDPEDSGNKAINYKTEPMWFREGFPPGADFQVTRDINFRDALSNDLVGGDPVTPVFTAQAGEQVRFRVLQASGHMRGKTFQVHGHYWQREPYISDVVPSQHIGDNPLSPIYPAQEGHGPENHFDVILREAGGEFGVTGDYMYRDQGSFGFDTGLWGLLRVQ